jgi:hypothetical protein
MAEGDPSSDLDVRLEWPHGEDPDLDVSRDTGRAAEGGGKARSQALERVAPQLPPGVKVLADQIESLARGVMALEGRLAEQVVRLEDLRGQIGWDSERVLAKLGVLREATNELRGMRQRLGSLVQGRAEREAQLRSQLTELTAEVKELRDAMPPRGGRTAAVDPGVVSAIADAVVAVLTAESGLAAAPAKKAPAAAKKPSATARTTSRAPAKKVAAKKKAPRATTRKR